MLGLSSVVPVLYHTLAHVFQLVSNALVSRTLWKY
jgi:hypothetical protein